MSPQPGRSRPSRRRGFVYKRPEPFDEGVGRERAKDDFSTGVEDYFRIGGDDSHWRLGALGGAQSLDEDGRLGIGQVVVHDDTIEGLLTSNLVGLYARGYGNGLAIEVPQHKAHHPSRGSVSIDY